MEPYMEIKLNNKEKKHVRKKQHVNKRFSFFCIYLMFWVFSCFLFAVVVLFFVFSLCDFQCLGCLQTQSYKDVVFSLSIGRILLWSRKWKSN